MQLATATTDIAAPPDRVFALWTTETGLCSWMARSADLDLRPGGRWTWTHDNGDTSSGEYVVIDPHDRLVFTYGWESGQFADVVAPGATTVEVTFEAIDSGTRVSVEHTGIAGEVADRHRAGWTHFLSVLAAVAIGGAAPSVNLPGASS